MSGLVGERLSELRKDYGYTQAQLAVMMHVTKYTISAWEQETSCPSVDKIVLLCKTLNVTSDYLLGLSNDYHASVSSVGNNQFTSEEKSI